MKKIIGFTLQPFLLIFILISCKKDTVIIQKDPGEKSIAVKVNTWLTDQLTISDEIKDDKIQLIKQNLNFKEARFEEFRNGGKFIIIPLKEGFTSRNNKNKNAVNNLVLISDEKGTIVKGNVIQYIPANNKIASVIPTNAFYQMYNDKLVEADGKFSFLTLSDRLLYEMNFKNGMVNAFGLAKAGKPGKTEEGEIATTIPQDPIGDCIPIDWYLLTTYYYEDGSTSQTQEYLYTTCQPNNGGGGSTIEYEYEEEYIRRGEITKVAYFIGSVDGGGSCTTFQILYGRFYKIHTEKDKITSCYFVRSGVNGNSLGATSSITTYNVTQPSKTSVRVAVAGEVKYPDNTYIPFTNTLTINMGDVAWHN